ncbi:MAG: hypothetical protein J2P13_08010, partial [Acidobacteria bacterium]|nr:hypothetical protein [Acidobacteriota bacterium]
RLRGRLDPSNGERAAARRLLTAVCRVRAGQVLSRTARRTVKERRALELRQAAKIRHAPARR